MTLALAAILAAGCGAPAPTHGQATTKPLICPRTGQIGSCSPITRVTLLPSVTGKPSAVTITTRRGNTTVLSHSYDSAAVNASTVENEQLDAEAVEQYYERLLSAQPPRTPDRFTLYFQNGASTLTPESNAQLSSILWSATHRPGGEIIVIGHTDRAGSAAANDALSLRRARAVRELIIQRGFDPLFVQAIGRGDRDPLIPTARGVKEPRNRRVEILVH
ncbi:MAG: OmpA family protein [Desulfovibrionaceae bacterium]|jgi:outer membrane protein OmpA-like peptidoglycan-associated protein|nr:OmpA family protein [Desulfovibrionaceae bacterium]